METTFEMVLEQARALPASERQKLVKALAKKSNESRKPKARKWDDDPEIRALRAWVDDMEKTENLKPNSAAITAQRIREWNDRGFKL